MTKVNLIEYFKPGQPLLIIYTDTEKDPITVKFREYLADKEALEVYDTSADTDGNNLDNTRLIDLNEIDEIKIPLDTPSSTSSKNSESEDYLSSRSGICHVGNFTKLLPDSILQLSLTERAQIEQKLSLKPKLIDGVGTDYQQAMEHIELQSMVSLVVCSNIQFFAIATQSRAFIFDMRAFGEVPDKLKFVLAAEDIKLLLHESRKIFEAVKTLYGITLRGVLDTFVAYRMFTGCSQPSLEDAIQRILRLPPDNLQSSSAVSNIEHCHHLVKLAFYQRKLYERLADNLLLERYNKTCQIFSRTIDDIEDNAEAAIIISQNKDYGFGCIFEALYNRHLLIQKLQNLNLNKQD